MKPINTLLLVVVISLIMTAPVLAQEIKSTKGHSEFRIKTSLKKMQAYDREHPSPKPIKRKPQSKPELTKERHSEIMADLWKFDQCLQSFKNLDYAREVLAIVPTWVWKHAGKTNINLFREMTTFDQDLTQD